MDDYIEHLMQDEPEAWLDALPSYQRNIIKDILKSEPDFLKAAEIYLSARPSKTSTASASQGGGFFLEKVLAEIEAFLCGDSKYEADRAKLVQAGPKLHDFAIALLSSVIAQHVGLSATFSPRLLCSC